MQYSAVAAGALLAFAGCTTGPATGPGPDAVSPDALDPRVESILRSACELLGGSQAFSFQAEITYDQVEFFDDEATTGVKVQYSAWSKFTVSRPGQLRVSYRGDREQREFFLDGNQATMLAPDENIYATLVTPGTIDEALDALWERAGVAPPLSDLVYRDPYARFAPQVVSSRYIGLHELDGTPCHHLFIAQESVDWQLWVDAGDRPLPRRIVITYRELPQAPAFAANFGGWDFEPSLAPGTFAFEPPRGAIKVDAVSRPHAGGANGESR